MSENENGLGLEEMEQDMLLAMFDSPRIIAVVGDPNSGKSNMLYWMVSKLREAGEFSLFTYGLRKEVPGATQIYSVMELETISNSIIILDEVMTLWDLNDRKNKASVENSLRLIHHNNNILVLSVLPENLKKFVASKVHVHIFKRSTLPDFINGSVSKRLAEMYSGPEKGSFVLNLPNNAALLFVQHYTKFSIPYMKEWDTKASNPSIISLGKTSTKTSEKTSQKTSQKTSKIRPLKFAGGAS